MKLFYRGGFTAILMAGVLFAGGVAEAASPTTVTWKVSSLNKGEKKRLSTLVSTKSPGVKTWAKSGSCTLTPLRKPTTLTMGVTGSCKLTLRIAKSGRYAAKISKKTITFATTVAPTTTTTVAPTTTTTVAPTTTTTAAPVASCATGGSCTPGVSTGAGGGRVFYYSAAPFTSTGSDCGTDCHYLEAATRYYGWEDWCTDHNYTTLGVTATGIGSGMANTITANRTCTSGAFQVAADYNNNGKYDWFLPSKDELNELYAYRTQLGFDLYTPLYWSSSEYNNAAAWMQDFGDGSQDWYWKSTRHMIPVRAG